MLLGWCRTNNIPVPDFLVQTAPLSIPHPNRVTAQVLFVNPVIKFFTETSTVYSYQLQVLNIQRQVKETLTMIILMTMLVLFELYMQLQA